MAQAPGATDTQPATSAPTWTSTPELSPFAVNAAEFVRDQKLNCDGLCVAAYVFNPEGRMLLVQRAPTDSMPLLWEVPGGGVDDEDETVLHSVARELKEESGLKAVKIVAEVGEPYSFTTRRKKSVMKFSFLVETDSHDALLDPEEHAAYVWASEEEARAKVCGDVALQYTYIHQENTILKAFEMEKLRRESETNRLNG